MNSEEFKFLNELFFKCPQTGQDLCIKDVSRNGDYIVVKVQGISSAWSFRIEQEESDFIVELRDSKIDKDGVITGYIHTDDLPEYDTDKICISVKLGENASRE